MATAEPPGVVNAYAAMMDFELFVAGQDLEESI